MAVVKCFSNNTSVFSLGSVLWLHGLMWHQVPREQGLGLSGTSGAEGSGRKRSMQTEHKP